MAGRILALVAICGLFQLSHIASVSGCPPRAVTAMKNFFSSRIHSVNGPTCFTLKSLRTVGENEGTYNNSATQSFKSCRDLCKKKGHDAGKIVALEMSLCHCDKNFKNTGSAEVSKCTHSCPGRIEERCGGPDHISAYPIDMEVNY